MNTNKSAKIHYLQTTLMFLLMFAAIPIVDSFSTHPTYAADPPPACQELTANLSDDKDYYTLAATASAGKDNDITGYQFDFGDHQSYTFNFDSQSTKDRRQASVKHTYQNAGTYTVIAKVISNQNGQLVHTSSPECTITVTIASAAELPATGPDIITTLIIAGAIGLTVYWIAFETIQGRLSSDAIS